MAIRINGATVISDAQAITSTSTISATGNVTAGNVITAGSLTVNGVTLAASGSNLTIGGNTVVTANATGTSSTTGNVTISGTVTGGNIATAGTVSATGNITGSYILGNGSQLTGISVTPTQIYNGTSNVTIPSTNGNVAVNVGSKNWTFDSAGNLTVPSGQWIQTPVGSNGNINFHPDGAGQLNIQGGSTGALIFINSDTANAQNRIEVDNFGNSPEIGGTFTGRFARGTAATPAAVQSDDQLAAFKGRGYDGTGYQNPTGLITVEAGANWSTGNLPTRLTFWTTPTGTSTPVESVRISPNGNLSVFNGNILTAGYVSATGNVTGSYILGNGSQLTGVQATSVGTLSSLSVTGTTTTGNLLSSGAISTSGTVTAASTVGGVITGSSASVTGAVSGASASVSGGVTAASVAGGVITGSSASVTGTVTGASVVGGSITLSSNTLLAAGPTLTIDPNGAGGTDGNVIITGNLSVTGNMTYINSNNVTTNDLTINMANNAATAAAANGGGIEVGPAGSPYITLTYNSTSNVWVASNGLNVAGIVSATGNITGGNISATNHTGTNVSVTGTVTAASTVGGVITGSSASVTGAVTAASTVGGVITGSSASVTGAVTGASLVGTITTASQTNITAIGTLSSLSVTGNVTSGNLSVGTGTITGGNIVNSNANGVGNIGSATTYFNTVFAKATSAQYADLAEKYTADAAYAPGTVVVFGGQAEVTVNAVDSDTKVAGVVSTNPSYIMNGTLEAEHVATVALTGRVPTMVVGSVKKGDMMVAAGLGRARAEADPKVGSVIGKALEDFDGAEGTIEVVVGRF